MGTFPKIEKLCGQLRVQELYHNGHKITVWPYRISYDFSDKDNNLPTQVLIWAPKSLFKHAVDRNRVRRMMREAYRLNKSEIETKGWKLAFNYMDKQIQSFDQIQKAMKRAIKKLQMEEKKVCN